MEIMVRKAGPDDLDAVYTFVCQLEETSFSFGLFAEGYKYNIEQPGCIYLVATLNGNIIGYISAHGQFLLHHLAKVFEIQEFFVAPGYRSKGIGSRLMEALEKEVNKTAGLIEVTAQTKRKNTHRFYISRGYKQTHLKFTKTLS